MFRTVVSPSLFLSSPPPLSLSLFLSLLETYLLTAARLIPPLSTGKRVPSLLLFLLPRAFIHFGSAVCRPVRGLRKKKTSHCRRLINSEARVERVKAASFSEDARGVSQDGESFEEIKRTEGIMWTHPFPPHDCRASLRRFPRSPLFSFSFFTVSFSLFLLLYPSFCESRIH